MSNRRYVIKFVIAGTEHVITVTDRGLNPDTVVEHGTAYARQLILDLAEEAANSVTVTNEAVPEERGT